MSTPDRKKELLPPWPKPVGTATGIFLRNSLTLEDDELVTILPNRVKMYTCGPTVYDWSHLGHARTYVGVDIMRRVLEDYFEIPVTFVVNVTDVDDKIIKKGNRLVVMRLLDLVNEVISDTDSADLVAVRDLFRKTMEVDTETTDKTQQLSMLQLVQFARHMRDVLSFVKSQKGDSIPFELSQADALTPEPTEVSRKFEQLYWADMRALDIRPPTVVTRVTEFIPPIVEFIEKIMENGYAYERHGSVYFDTVAYSLKHKYGVLEPWSIGDLKLASEGETEWSGATVEAEAEGEGEPTNFRRFEAEIAGLFDALSIPKVAVAEPMNLSRIEKKHPFDFALWKLSNPGEPAWDSPWGRGRPGWHIECSVMSTTVLGTSFDIHTGGIDLAFPHHENEIAQTQAYTDVDGWVNYFCHMGHLHIDGQKMSKSDKNFTIIKDALELFTSKEIRMLFLTHLFFQPLDYSRETMDDAKRKVATFAKFFQNMDVKIREGRRAFALQIWTQHEFDLFEDFSKTQLSVDEALRMNINTKEVIELFIQLRSRTYQYLEAVGENYRTPILFQISAYMTHIFSVFGLVFPNNLGFSEVSADTQREDKIIDTLAAFRDTVRGHARRLKDQSLLEACDELRDDLLPPLGIKIEDERVSSSWKRDSPKVILAQVAAERAERERRQAAAAARKAAAAQRRAEAEARDRIDPVDMYQQDPQFAGFLFDEQGIPVASAAGEAVSKSRRKKLVRGWNGQKKRHDRWLKRQPQ